MVFQKGNKLGVKNLINYNKSDKAKRTVSSMKLINIMGKRFGKLTVLNLCEERSHNHTVWLCKCDCGNIVKKLKGSLTSGRTVSCGCQVHGNCLAKGLAAMRQAKNNVIGRARKRGLEYNLTENQFKELTQRECFYCGAFPSNEVKHNYQTGGYIYNGLDRIDNTQGYTIGNCVSCCKQCNIAKGTLIQKDFIFWVEKVYLAQAIGLMAIGSGGFDFDFI